MEVVNRVSTSKNLNSLYRINPLPPHVTWIQVGTNHFTCSFAKAKKRSWRMNGEPTVQLKSDFDIAIRCEFTCFFPVRNDFVRPLPVQNLLEIIRPRSYWPVRILRIFMVAWAARERVNDRNFKALSQFNRLYNSIVKLFRDVFLRVQRVTVRA
ncbi:hypothetical protein D3C85_1270680 [compost metagenome]